ncbi:alpha/beta hydrolase [Amycolatopsis nigrescens]|uniref:alpha/beta hydrolase n=1 Tax=Amycolatopsis nigrescens TaxID=381445 RepID=UPI0003818F40|nr:alpha/beta hydrolase-fold protein [Amycolatopsis nigrescens]
MISTTPGGSRPDAGETTVVTETWFSAALNRTKRVNILLPPDYATGRHRYPVLYLLHGYGGNRDTWLRNTALPQCVRWLDLIVVLPESGRRWFINDHEGHRYEDYLVHELVPLVDRNFRSTPDRAGRAVAGFSMGGAAAVFQALRHQTTFSAAAGLGGAFEAPLRMGDPYAAHRGDPGLLMPTVESHERVWGEPGSPTRQTYSPYRLLDRYDRSTPIAFYLGVGTEDYGRVLRMNRTMHGALRERGIVHEYHECPGGHDWDFVTRALPATLEFLSRHLTPARPGGTDEP